MVVGQDFAGGALAKSWP